MFFQLPYSDFPRGRGWPLTRHSQGLSGLLKEPDPFTQQSWTETMNQDPASARAEGLTLEPQEAQGTRVHPRACSQWQRLSSSVVWISCTATVYEDRTVHAFLMSTRPERRRALGGCWMGGWTIRDTGYGSESVNRIKPLITTIPTTQATP